MPAVRIAQGTFKLMFNYCYDYFFFFFIIITIFFPRLLDQLFSVTVSRRYTPMYGGVFRVTVSSTLAS
jgi:hypothetical protein